MRIVLASVISLASAAFLSVGCTVGVRGPSVEVDPVEVEVGAPVVDVPTVDVEILPPIEERVYVYDPGFPPGVYVVGGFYFYNGHRYEHDVFYNRIVEVNIREHHFIDREKNQRVAAKVIQKQKVEYAKTGGHRTAVKPEHKEVVKPEHKEVVKPEHKEVEHKEVEHKEIVKPEHKEVEHKEVEHKEVVKPEHKEVAKPAEHARPPEKPVNGKERKPEEEKK